MIVVFIFIFSPLPAVLASNGSAANFALHEPISWSHWTWSSFLESLTVDVMVVVLIVLPELAHRGLPWRYTLELTRIRVTRWLATSAMLLTGLLVLMFHFSVPAGKPKALAHIDLGPLAIGLLFALALLLPIYRSAVKAFWECGILHLIDLGRWRADEQKVLKEVRTGRDRLARELEASLGFRRAPSRNTHPEETVPASLPGMPPTER